MCNATWHVQWHKCLRKQLMPNVTQGTIITSNAKGAYVFIPRIAMIPNDTGMLFIFK